MTKLCAQAMGLKPYVVDGQEQAADSSALYMLTPEWHVERYFYYAPLRLDAQGMELVRKLGLSVYPWNGGWCAEKSGQYGDNRDILRAIVLCVSKLPALGDTLSPEKR
jgi:hypothetical protein